MPAPADNHYELPGTYVIAPSTQRRPPRVAAAGIVLFGLLLLAAVVGAVLVGLAIFG
jgi:hypothetical protein